MKKLGIVFVAVAIALSLTMVGKAIAGSKKKYTLAMEDERAKVWSKKTWKTSKKVIRWKMSDTWGGLKLHDVPLHFAQSVEAASGGRLKIKVYPTGAICGAFELLDTVSKGTLDAGHSFSGYWKGKDEAFVLYSSVPFGMDAESFNVWYYQGGGDKLMDELYGKFGLKAFACGNAGQELGLYSKKPMAKMAEFKGIKVRTVGWFMDILTKLGVSVTPIPGSEVYLALERGVVDAAEFSSPAITYFMGFHEVAKYVIEPGVHQPGTVTDLFINKKSWDALPDDLKAIVEICAAETNQWEYTWFEFWNIAALKELKKAGVTFVKMAPETLNEFRKKTHEYTEELKKKYPMVNKILTSQENFLKEYATWRELRSGVAPWPYEDYIKGKHLH